MKSLSKTLATAAALLVLLTGLLGALPVSAKTQKRRMTSKTYSVAGPTLVNDGGTWYYVQNHKVNRNARTLVKYKGVWYAVKNGTLDRSTTLVRYNGTWYYVEKGAVNWNSDTLVKYNGEWFYARHGTVDWRATTLVKYNGVWYYVQNGKVNFSATTLVKYKGIWYYVQKGAVNFRSNTLVKYNGVWYYTHNGGVDWRSETLVPYNGNLFYVRGGSVWWSMPDMLAEYEDRLYMVTGGQVEVTYTGNIQVGDIICYVIHGEVICPLYDEGLDVPDFGVYFGIESKGSDCSDYRYSYGYSPLEGRRHISEYEELLKRVGFRLVYSDPANGETSDDDISISGDNSYYDCTYQRGNVQVNILCADGSSGIILISVSQIG